MASRLTNAGATFLAGAVTGIFDTAAFDSTNAHIGVGDSTTPFATTQTDLQAATNKLRKPMVTNFPARTTNQISFRTTFDGPDANWVWNEFGVFNAVTGGVMLIRDVDTTLGTKVAGDIWTLEVVVTFGA